MELAVKILAICNGIQLFLILLVFLQLSRQTRADRSEKERGGVGERADTFAGSQNRRYVELWGSLQKLSLVVDDLWENVTTRRVADLLSHLRTTKRQVDEWSLFFDEEHLRELRRLFDVIESFHTGKLTLDEIRSKRDLSYVRIEQIKFQVEQNAQFKGEMEDLLGNIRRDFRERLAALARAGAS